MLKTIRSRKRNHLISLLAVFYLVLGGHILHPHYHNQEGLHLEDEESHSTPACHSHPVGIGSLSPDKDPYSCPICDFFATCSQIKLTADQSLFFSTFVQRVLVDFLLPDNFRIRLIHHIRGPPLPGAQ